MKRDYSKLDAAILEHFRNNPKWGAPNSTALCCLAEEIAPGVIPWRLVDRRVQALRKSGAISYSSRHGWLVA